MPPNYREQQGHALSASERRGALFLVGALVLSGLGVGAWAGTRGGPSAQGPCVSVVVPRSMGGTYITHCGRDARSWCAGLAPGRGALASAAYGACRRSGLPTAG